MTILQRVAVYDRGRILEAATRARSKGRRRKAIALLRRVLVVEPDNPELHARIAPLLAETGQHFDAWRSFRAAGRDFVKGRRFARALATYREAARSLPQQAEAWLAVAKLERKLHGPAPAVEALLEGRRHMRTRRSRPQAIAVLREVRGLDPLNLPANFDLARLLAKGRQREEALLILDALAERCDGSALRQVRGAQWRMTRTLHHTWLWLRAATAALSEDEPATSREAAARPSTI